MFRDFLGIDEMSGAPVTLHKPPRSSNVHGVPRVTEPVILEPNSGLIAGRLTVALDDYAVKTGVAGKKTLLLMLFCLSSWQLSTKKK